MAGIRLHTLSASRLVESNSIREKLKEEADRAFPGQKKFSVVY
jgi:hypothetical protein